MSLYFVEFVLLSLVGWVYECTYCTIRTGRWQNRGFLYGPICPIYGAGAVAAFAICHHLPWLFNSSTTVWRIFLISAALSAVLEYSTSFALERIFHAVWWDYSDLPLNLHGRICLPASTLFGLMGVGIVKLLLPLETSLAARSIPLLTESVALLLCFCVGIDTGLTVDSLLRLGERLDQMQEEFDRGMESRVKQLKNAPAALTAQAKQREQALTTLVLRHQRSLPARQRYLLSNMSFRGGTRRGMGERLQNAAAGMRRHLEDIRARYTPEEYSYLYDDYDNPGD